jgi:hypothetical protein
LLSWSAILGVLKLPVSGRRGKAARRLVRRLVRDYKGPVALPTRGRQPRTERARLLAWWHQIDAIIQEACQEQHVQQRRLAA